MTLNTHLSTPFRPSRFSLATGLPALLLALAGPAQAQVTVKPDGQWRSLTTAGLTVNSGNTRSTAFNLGLDSVRATESSKWSALGQLLYTDSAGQTTGERALISSQYNGDIEPWRSTFAFVQAAGLTDRPANTRDRFTLSTGMGAHLLRRPDEFWDVWAGVALANERYVRPVEFDGVQRSHLTDTGLVLAQEANLRLSPSTTLRQKLVLLPSLRESGLVRTEFDGQVSVAVSERVSLSTGLSVRHTTRPAPGLRGTDVTLVTGLSLRYD
jgi:putative salt-induced outer membrane protein YdiY